MPVDFSEIVFLLRDYRMSFFLRGNFAERYTNTIVDLSENVANQMEEGFFSRKMSFMLVESFQNILKHGQTQETLGVQLEDEGIFSFKVNEKGNFINSINFIQPGDDEGLRMSIDYINSLDKASLKSYYMDSLKNNEMSSKGGAGLGFIEMARKSGSKILYRIEHNEGSPIHFHQQISLKRNDDNGEEPDEIIVTDKIYRAMRQMELVMLYQGDFSPKIMLPLIEMAEQSIQNSDSETPPSIRAAHVVVEMIQNIQRHGIHTSEAPSNGYFAVGRENDRTYLITVNPVHSSEVVELKKRLDDINALDEAGRKDLLRSILKASLAEDQPTSRGLGLSEIAGSTRGPLAYSFTPSSQGIELFTLQVEI